MGILQKASGSVATLSQSARNSCPKPLEVRNHFQKVCFGFCSQEIFHLKNKFELCQLIGQQELSFPPTWWPCSTTSPPTSTPWPSSLPPWPPSILNPSSPWRGPSQCPLLDLRSWLELNSTRPNNLPRYLALAGPLPTSIITICKHVSDVSIASSGDFCSENLSQSFLSLICINTLLFMHQPCEGQVSLKK